MQAQSKCVCVCVCVMNCAKKIGFSLPAIEEETEIEHFRMLNSGKFMSSLCIKAAQIVSAEERLQGKFKRDVQNGKRKSQKACQTVTQNVNLPTQSEQLAKRCQKEKLLSV